MKLKELNSDLSAIERDYVRLEFENLRIQDEIIKLQQSTPNIDQEEEHLFSLQKDYNITKDDCAEVSRTLDEYQVVSNLLKDSGIKSQIIKNMYPSLIV